jgi:ubiquinone/menaquinone biosynthesis C-methylase UbiE
MDRHATSLALEQKYVYKVYDSIAPYFSHTRHKAWPKVAEFLENMPPGSLVADVGKEI